jgi:ABC-2 type transport system permease protein
MNRSLKKIGILAKRDIIDFFRNPALSFALLLPVGFVVLYHFLDMPMAAGGSKPEFLLNFGMLMNTCMCGVMIPSTTIAEEKEKNTLRTLMLSNVGGMEFLTAKLAVGIFLTMLGNVLVFALSGTEAARFGIYFAASFLASLTVCLLSAGVGILSRDQMSGSALQIPVMLLFLVPAALCGINAFLQTVAELTPLYAGMQIYRLGLDGRLFSGEALRFFAVLLVWTAAGTAVFALAYKKRGLDN